MTAKELEIKLDGFDKAERLEALKQLKKTVKPEPGKNKGFVNLHCHTFYSFNGFGYSPERVAWMAYCEGLSTVGTVDFDVLDAVNETLESGRILGIRAVSGIETRVFVKDLGGKIINSPGEPGVYYLVGTGFYKKPDEWSKSAKLLQKFGRIARERNILRLTKVNQSLKEIAIDYDRDVLPLTPKGNATERHILSAFIKKASDTFTEKNKLDDYWAEKLGLDKEQASGLSGKPAELAEAIRSKLFKKASNGALDVSDSFPALEEVVEMIKDEGALPTAAYLDGTSECEKDIRSLLAYMMSKGVAVLNIVPDRNWNIKDPAEKELKVANLREAILAARELKLPVIAGTEMNKTGLKQVDDFNAPELKPYLNDFLSGAYLVYGHTIVAKYFDMGYNSAWAVKNLAERGKRNEFYAAAGRKIDPSKDYSKAVNSVKNSISPEKLLELL